VPLSIDLKGAPERRLGARLIPPSRTAESMVTNHQQPDSRVGRPGRESNPVHSFSRNEAVVQTQGAVENGCSRPRQFGLALGIVGTRQSVRRGLRAPSPRRLTRQHPETGSGVPLRRVGGTLRHGGAPPVLAVEYLGAPAGPGISVRERILEWHRELTERSRRSRLLLRHEGTWGPPKWFCRTCVFELAVDTRCRIGPRLAMAPAQE